MNDGRRSGFWAISAMGAVLAIGLALNALAVEVGDSSDHSPPRVSMVKTTATNLVVNPSFEDGSEGWTEGPLSLFPGTSVWRSYPGATVHSGTKGYTISNLANGQLVSAHITVDPLTDYDLFVHVKGELDPDETLNGLLIRAYFYNGGTYVGNQTAFYDYSCEIPNYTWQRVGGTITTPSGVDSVRIWLFNHLGSGWIAFDDVEFINPNSPSVNLVGDPGFEDGGDYWTELPGAEFPNTSVWRSRPGSTVRSGTYGYTISNLAYGNLRSDPITIVNRGTSHDLYVWVKGELDPDEGLNGLLFRAYYYDDLNRYISNETAYQDQTGANLTETWQRVGGQITPPSNAHTLQIWMYNYLGSGWIAFDDVELFDPSNPGVNMVDNPGFEEGANDWTERRMSSFPGTSFWRTNYRFPTPHSGDFDYTISNLAYGHLISDHIEEASPLTDYDLYVWVKGELDPDESMRGLLIRAYFYNSSGGYLGYQNVVNDTTVSILSDTWQRLGGQITTPAEAESVRILLYNWLGSGWIAFDDVEFTMVGPPPPGFSVQPSPTTVVEGEAAQFQAAVTGGDPPLSHQWEYRPDGGSWSTVVDSGPQGPISGATTDTLSISPAALEHAGTYRLQVTDSATPARTATSNEVQLTVNEAPDLRIASEEPVDLYFRESLWSLYRKGTMLIDTNYELVIPVELTGATSAVDVEVHTHVRMHDPAAQPNDCGGGGWAPFGAAGVQTKTINPGAADLEIGGLYLDSAYQTIVFPPGKSWGLLDLGLQVGPMDGDSDPENDIVCISAWIIGSIGEPTTSISANTLFLEDFTETPQINPTGVGVESYVHTRNPTQYRPDTDLLSVTVIDPAEPRLVWEPPTDPGRQVSGALIRYRRAAAGVGGDPNLAAGAEEAAATTLTWSLHDTGLNEHVLLADNQWHTLRWRRGSLPPFGGDVVPILQTPGTTGNVLSFHLSPDSNCSTAGSPCPGYPETLIDFVYVWWEPSGAAAPSFDLTGLRYRVGADWLPLMGMTLPVDAELAAMITNIGDAAGVASGQVTMTISGPEAATLTGAASLSLAASESGYVPVNPNWQPTTVGNYQISTSATVNQQNLPTIQTNVTVSPPQLDCSTTLILPTDLVE